MKKYRDEYDDENDDEEEVVEVEQDFVADKLSLFDYLVAAILAFVVFGLLSLWSFPSPEPMVWQDLAEAAGTRPPKDIFPGIWRWMCSPLFKSMTIPAATSMLALVGKIAVGLMSAMLYLTFREGMALMVRLRLQYSKRRHFVASVASVVGALMFAFSDPVWHAGQFFSSTTFLLFLAVLGIYLFFLFLHNGSLIAAYASMLVIGFLAAETPLAFALVAVCWGIYFVMANHVLSIDMPLLNPFIAQSSKWHLTFLFLIALIGGIIANCTSFIDMGGMEAVKQTVGDLPVAYGMRMWNSLTSAGTVLGWLFALVVVIVPVIVCTILLPRAADEEQFLPYHFGGVYLISGIVALSQFCQIDALWFWHWLPSPVLVPSQLLLCMFMLVLSLLIVFAIAVLGIEVFCRNHRRLTIQMYAELNNETMPELDKKTSNARRWARMVGGIIFLLAVFVAVLPGRRLEKTREMLAITSDYITEVISECGTVKWLFTDGSCDPYLEVMAASHGIPVRPVSMMSRNGAYETYLRSRTAADSEDRLSLEVGGGMALRTWIRDKRERLAEVAQQLGLELWKRDGHPLPPCSGVLSRSSGMDDSEIVRGVENARAIAKRILDLYSRGGPPREAGHSINEIFLFIQWRLARLARMRAERSDLAGNVQRSLADMQLSEELDEKNASLKRILDDMEKARALALKQITPREGLQMALTRADFKLAYRYAEVILRADPDEPQANFGVGMYYFVQEQWTRAETYLRRCIIRNPKEPAIYNNLAVLQMKTGRFDAAEKNARHALKLVPDSAEIQDTLKQVLKAREEALKRAAKQKKAALRKLQKKEDD